MYLSAIRSTGILLIYLIFPLESKNQLNSSFDSDFIQLNVRRRTLTFDEHQRISGNINRGVNEFVAGLSSRLIDGDRPCIHMLIGCLIWFTGPQRMSVIYTVKSWLGSGNETADCRVTPVVWIRLRWTYSFHLPLTAERHVGTVALPFFPMQCTIDNYQSLTIRFHDPISFS